MTKDLDDSREMVRLHNLIIDVRPDHAPERFATSPMEGDIAKGCHKVRVSYHIVQKLSGDILVLEVWEAVIQPQPADAGVGEEEPFTTCLGLVSDLKQLLVVPEKMGVPLGVVGVIAPSQQLIRIEVV